VYYYPKFDSFLHSEKLYYEIFRNLTRYTAIETACRIRMSYGLNLLNYHTPAGRCPNLDFQLAAMNADHYVCVTIEPNTLKDHMVYLQFVALHTSVYGQRLLRVINVGFEALTTFDSKNLYSKLNFEPVFFLWMRQHIDECRNIPKRDVRAELVKELKDILLAFREEGGVTNMNEISVPRKIDSILVITHALLRDPVLDTKHRSLKNDVIMANFLFYQQNSPAVIMAHLYPKVFPLHELYKPTNDKLKDLPGTTQESGCILMPDSVPASFESFEFDGVYFIDCGDLIYMYVKQQAQVDCLEGLFGVTEFDDLAEAYTFPYLEESDWNMRAQNILQEIRDLKGGYYPALVVILEGDVNDAQWRSCLVEDDTGSYKISAWSFMKQINDMMTAG
jgi:protein transport protein SEC24